MSLSRPFDHRVLVAVVLLAGFADQFRMVQLGPISGLAALTLVECGVVWCSWIREPWSPARDGGIVSMVLFSIWALGTLFWAPATLLSLQTLVVFLLFLGLLLLSVREGYRNPQLPHILERALDWMSVIVALVCLMELSRGSAEVDSPTNARSVAIVMLIGLAWQLAAWQHGRRGRLLVAGGMVILIILSRSRMASGVAILLFPLSMVVGGRRNLKLARVIQVLVVGAALIGCLFAYEPIRERILGSASLWEISEQGVDSSGRVEMWGDIFESFQRHMWLGQGVGATSPYTDRPGMYHPHNDYLLLAHDYGLLGMGLFVLGLAISITRIVRYLRRMRGIPASRDAGDALCLSGVLATVVLLLVMTTDNALTYAFVMAPIAVLLGVSLAQSSRTQRLNLKRAARAVRTSLTMRGEPACRSRVS